MKITIYTQKISKKFISSANSEYLKRLSKYCKIKVIEKTNFEKELDDINKTYKINLTIEKDTIRSEDFADYLGSLALNSNSNVSFFVNSSSDFSFDDTITISKMGINEELLTTILLEQIYRAYRINKNEPYHK